MQTDGLPKQEVTSSERWIRRIMGIALSVSIVAAGAFSNAALVEMCCGGLEKPARRFTVTLLFLGFELSGALIGGLITVRRDVTVPLVLSVISFVGVLLGVAFSLAEKGTANGLSHIGSAVAGIAAAWAGYWLAQIARPVDSSPAENVAASAVVDKP
jgi:hypothetical protein